MGMVGVGVVPAAVATDVDVVGRVWNESRSGHKMLRMPS